jgi:hypothetical protein
MCLIIQLEEINITQPDKLLNSPEEGNWAFLQGYLLQIELKLWVPFGANRAIQG